MYVYYNPNPKGNKVGDCVIRGISKVMDKSWDDVYLGITTEGFLCKDMPSANYVWGHYLQSYGFSKYIIPNDFKYTVKDFCYDNPHGKFLLATGTHVIGVVDGNYYDIWDSGEEIPVYYWHKERER